MKPFKMRSYYLVPLILIAAIACAKRDNEFAKKAGAAKAAAQQKVDQAKAAEEAKKSAEKKQPSDEIKPDGSKPPEDTVKANEDQPLKDASKADNSKPMDDAIIAEDAKIAKDITNEPDDIKAAGDIKKPEETKKASAKSYEGDLTTQASCKNKISMALGENEEDLVLSDLVATEEGTYTLQSAELFIEESVASERTVQQVNAIAIPFNLPEGKHDVAGKNLQVACQTLNLTEKSTQKLSGLLNLPYDISAKDGSIKHLRQDTLVLSKAEQTATSRIYANPDPKYDLKKLLSTASDSTKIEVRRTKDSRDFTLIMQIKKKSARTVTTKTLKGTYSFKK